jgi:molybdopterin converting factor small subunit
MPVQVTYMSQIKAALNRSGEEVDVPTPCTVRELLARLLERHGKPLERLLCDSAGQLQPSVLVCVRDRQVRLSDPTPVNDADQVTLLAPISGG